jgi:hypothetical protein
MFTAFPRQQWFRERASILRLYVHCLSYSLSCTEKQAQVAHYAYLIVSLGPGVLCTVYRDLYNDNNDNDNNNNNNNNNTLWFVIVLMGNDTKFVSSIIAAIMKLGRNGYGLQSQVSFNYRLYALCISQLNRSSVFSIMQCRLKGRRNVTTSVSDQPGCPTAYTGGA